MPRVGDAHVLGQWKIAPDTNMVLENHGTSCDRRKSMTTEPEQGESTATSRAHATERKQGGSAAAASKAWRAFGAQLSEMANVFEETAASKAWRAFRFASRLSAMVNVRDEPMVVFFGVMAL